MAFSLTASTTDPFMEEPISPLPPSNLLSINYEWGVWCSPPKWHMRLWFQILRIWTSLTVNGYSQSSGMLVALLNITKPSWLPKSFTNSPTLIIMTLSVQFLNWLTIRTILSAAVSQGWFVLRMHFYMGFLKSQCSSNSHLVSPIFNYHLMYAAYTRIFMTSNKHHVLTLPACLLELGFSSSKCDSSMFIPGFTCYILIYVDDIYHHSIALIYLPLTLLFTCCQRFEQFT